LKAKLYVRLYALVKLGIYMFPCLECN
jgi:hypothetical protein